jgi:hypothetical protein
MVTGAISHIKNRFISQYYEYIENNIYFSALNVSVATNLAYKYFFFHNILDVSGCKYQYFKFN